MERFWKHVKSNADIEAYSHFVDVSDPITFRVHMITIISTKVSQFVLLM